MRTLTKTETWFINYVVDKLYGMNYLSQILSDFKNPKRKKMKVMKKKPIREPRGLADFGQHGFVSETKLVKTISNEVSEAL